MLSGTISPELFQEAYDFAKERSQESRDSGRQPISFSGDPSGTWDVDGALGEVIVSQALNLPRPLLNTFKDIRDVGPFEVQAVRRDSGDNRGASLIIRPADLQKGAGDWPYILVLLKDDTFKLVGWIYGKEGPELGRRYGGDTGRPCWMVPKNKLRGMSYEFLGLIKGWKEQREQAA